ncbi:MAG TPA: sigma-54 dependent transcriptional regulator [Acidobacteriota bacterium]
MQIPSRLVGRSAALARLKRLIERVAPLPVTVLIEGASGTGKELVARELHLRSPRRARPLVAINCAAVPEALLESELFGHARGAFTGAETERRGLVEEAEGSTLFLDEIGDLPLRLQAKLLRFLQEREYRRVGCCRLRHADVRIVAATHCDLAARVEAQQFREDLYYRLLVVTLELPALRQRREDIPLLAQHFLSLHAERLGRPRPALGAETLERIQGYDWPGNVRELENELLSALALLEPGQPLGPEALSVRLGAARAASAGPLSYREALNDFARRYVGAVLRDHGGNRTRTAAALGLSRQALVQKLKALELDGGRGSGYATS